MEEHFRRRNLPHLDLPGATYFVTGCLAGSIPAQGLLDLERFHRRLDSQVRPLAVSEEQWQTRIWKLAFARCDHWLDLQSVVRHLEDPRLAAIVTNSIHHFAGQRYDLFAYVIMPSHFHWVFRPREDWVASLGAEADERTPRERIVHSLRTYTALRCNRLLGLTGSFWQVESHDHIVRDLLELERVIRYVEYNPVKAGLVQSPEKWLFSSARDRLLWNIPLGLPLLRPIQS